MEPKKHEAVDKMWIELMIATAIGPNLGLYQMLDPEGQSRGEALKKSMRAMVSQTHYNLVVMGGMSDEDFVAKAYLNIIELYNSFIQARMVHMLKNGVPKPKLILQPNPVAGPTRRTPRRG